MSSIGVLGGAFNPPHIGHLLLAREAREQLALDEVVLVPTGVAPHKRIDPEPGQELRLEMTRLAAADAGVDSVETWLTVSALEVEREGPSFAYRTLELLADERPGSQLTFVMGADAAAGLEGWRRPERVLELARVAVADRPGAQRDAVDEVVERLGDDRGALAIEMPQIGISSSLVRDRVAAGRSVRWLVPEPVAGLIAQRGLYGSSTSSTGAATEVPR
ncbi:MAG: nicotinate-nucleotide adenylyltransferase [Solirubrobacterales bacterium]